MAQNKDEEFAFIKEKIKDKPINKKKLLIKGTSTIVSAVVFGVVACLVFTAMRPVMENWLHAPEKTKVTIPKDEEDTYLETETEAIVSTEQTAEPVANQYVLTPEEYQKLQTQICAIGTRTNRSIVTVTGVKKNMDWFNTPHESQGQDSGVIVADNGAEFLIMTEQKVIANAERIEVTFVNGTTVNAELKKYDGNTGIAILGVKRSDIDETTLNIITVATLGNSLQSTQGSVVIALGSPLGTNFSILTGIITSTENVISTYDANYKTLTTDIAGNSTGSGVLINLDGEVVGLIMQDFDNVGNGSTLTAVSISQLKDVIEKLLNEEDIPYLGLKITTVNTDISETYDVPKGIYIKSVAMDSPAMTAGLRNGDVIVEMDGEEVLTTQAYKTTLMTLEPDDEVCITVKRLGADGYEEMDCYVTVGILQ